LYHNFKKSLLLPQQRKKERKILLAVILSAVALNFTALMSFAFDPDFNLLTLRIIHKNVHAAIGGSSLVYFV
jgi:hypothetical protein